MFQNLTITQLIAVWALPVLFAIAFHEAAHGWVANKFGDKTALMMGRVTLNPIKHIDPIGTVVVPILLLYMTGYVFGWAKPVPVNWNNLKNPRRDMALVAAAGPISNLLMAIIWVMILKIGIILTQQGMSWAIALAYMGQAGLSINLLLMVINLIPIPPLDGSRVVTSLLSPKAAYGYNRIEPYGFFIVFGLFAFGLLQYVLLPPIRFLSGIILAAFGIQ